MSTLEEKFQDFVNKQGIDVVGVAGPERMAGSLTQKIIKRPNVSNSNIRSRFLY